MNKFVIAILFAAALVFAGCSSEEPEAPTTPGPVVPEVPDVPEVPTDNTEDEATAPVDGEANVLDDSTDILGGGTEEALGSKIDGVACDTAEQKITFSFTNTGIHTWSLDQTVGFGDSGDTKNVKVFMNHRYEMNANRVQFHPVSGEQMFGPNELFSDNCGGVTELAVGESVECTLHPVPLNRGSGSNDLKGVNYILIDSPAIDDLIEFTC